MTGALARLACWLLPLAVLGACAAQPIPAEPAIWEVRGDDGGKAWLFGTIHGFERPVRWNTGPVKRAFDAADMVMVEVADLDDKATVAKTFSALAHSPEMPPLTERVRPPRRDELVRVLNDLDLEEGQFSEVETWAAALTIARAASAGHEADHGTDRAVARARGNRRIVEFEGAESQLRLFDALPEREQRDLLEAIVREAGTSAADRADIAQAWRNGDMETLERQTGQGLLADPELRKVLLVARNQRWTRRIVAAMARGHAPFVAVGAAHMAGPDGLPAMMAAQGFTVTRLQ